MTAARVLVVDDSPTIRKVVGSVLTRAGYEIVHAADGLAALGALKQSRYALALVDFVMPKLNGFELCKKIRDDPELRDLPVILMSAKADKIRDHFLKQTGALDALTKPFDPRALLLTVEAALHRVGEGTSTRRPDSHAPSSGPSPFAAEDTGSDALPPSTSRGRTTEAFLHRLSEAIARLPIEARGESDPAAIASALLRTMGEDALASAQEAIAGPDARAVLSGDITAIPLAEVLQLLQLQRQSGLLTIDNGRTLISLAMRDGLIDIAVSRGAADEFRLGRYVVETGKLDRARLDELLTKERAAEKPRLLGDVLVAESVLTREELAKALERQTSELVYDVLRWTRGRFVFDHKAGKSEATSAKLGLPVASIVMEGFRRVDEWRLMEGVLGDFEQTFYRDPGAIEALGTMRLSREERVVLTAIDGERSVRELIGAVEMGSFDVCKILYQLVQSRLVRRRTS